MQAVNPLAKLIPTRAVGCPHVLGRWVLRTSKATSTYPDGRTRPVALRGGRLVRSGAGCVYTPGHVGAHRTDDGRTWP